MFDKTKAMRSAERYLSQGKIRDAIGEYQKVVDNDPRDIVTLNMLGDLHSKNADVRAAVNCYMDVAEHYSKQGFAQKAIAIYNKISRIQPNSLAVSEKLAELYKSKGSAKEAKSHYETLAEHYSKQGRRIEALEIWKEIASLDPNNTEVYLTIADAYLQEERLDDAADAFCKAGERLMRHSRSESAMEAFEKAFAIDPKFPNALQGFIDAKFAMDKPADAVEKLELLLEDNPLDRELLSRLADAFLRMKDPAGAEKTILRLVEVDPSCYLKCIDLSELYREKSDTESALRILTIASEHMLVGGQAPELQTILEQIDATEPDRLDVVRLLARFCAWQKDDEYLRTTLVRLNDAAARDGSIDDERYALSQLVMLMPQEAAYAARLKAINEELGISNQPSASATNGNDRFVNPVRNGHNEASEGPNVDNDPHIVESDDFAIVGIVAETVDEPRKEADERKKKKKRKKSDEVVETGSEIKVEPIVEQPADDFQKEVDSIRFYIENGYNELAEKAIGELRGTHGDRPELQELIGLLAGGQNAEVSPASAEQHVGDNGNGNGHRHGMFDLGDLRNELGIDEPDLVENGDFETQFQTAVAYKEMGLLEQAISEFQDAAAIVSPNDGSRRFFNCANLLGHCFMEMGKPNMAVKWHLRSLESFDIADEERQGVWYELGVAYEANGDIDSAAKYFEQVYVENIDFRDISERMKNMAVPA